MRALIRERSSVGEHLLYTQGVVGSNPAVPTSFYGPVVEMVTMPACHAGGREFDPRRVRHSDGEVAQVVEQWTENPRVPSSSLGFATFRKGHFYKWSFAFLVAIF